MNEKLGRVAFDVIRFGPFATVSFATAVCFPSLLEFLRHTLTTATMIERYFLALLLARIAVANATKVLLRFAADNARSSHGSEAILAPSAGNSPGEQRD